MKNIIFIILIISPISLFSQNIYYWKQGKKIELSENHSTEIIYEKKDKSFKVANSENIKYVYENNDLRNGKYKIIEYRDSKLKESIDKSIVKSVSFGLTDVEGSEMWLSHFVVVKFKPEYSVDNISRIISKYNSIFVGNEFGVFKFEVIDIENVISFANEIFESNTVIWSQPDFMISTSSYSWEDQYFLNNKSHTYCGGFDNDINALNAWNLTKGCANITVAVIDEGVEDHPDLRDELGNSRVLNGYTPSGITNNGRPGYGDNHGQACAGIIAASHNSNVHGIAPYVKILPVKIRFGTGIPSSEYANAIRWAYQNGADILSNSWGGGNDQNVIDAINEAQLLGRNGKGSIVVFSSGNDGLNSVSTYANLSIGVGAINKYDKPASLLKSIAADKRYTNIGSGQDLVAYGGDVDCDFWSDDCLGDIHTIDRTGSNGYIDGDYFDNFSGTSAACPQVSGVAALILSINPNLTRQEVENILFSTSVDLGISGRDDTYGYGKVNAYEAVKSALNGFGYNLHFIEGYLNYTKIQDNTRVTFISSPSCNDVSGIYWCDIYKAQATIPYNSNWLNYQGDGLSGANPNSGQYYVSIINGNSTIDISTYFYYIKTNYLNQTINKWVPSDPSLQSSRKYLITPPPYIEYSGTIISGQNQQLIATNRINFLSGSKAVLGSICKAQIVTAPQTFECLPNPTGVISIKSTNNDTLREIPIVAVGDDNIALNNILIYPNPNQGNFKVDFSGTLEKDATIEIYNLNGQILFKTVLFENNQNIIFTDTKGIYIIKIFNGVDIYTDKLILE